ncbi:MAG: NAD-binding protein [Desulfomonilia bacterium]|jgi:voltage-gated potassium channel
MKFLSAILSTLARGRVSETNIRVLLRYLAVLLGLIIVYSVIFHYLMLAEGQEHSWITGLYWTLVVMSTLGFGDITFTQDIGKAFSILVLISGVVFLLILLPFIFIKFFFAPWMESEARRRTPRELPPETSGHVIITAYDAVTASLIEKLRDYRQNYVVVVEDLQRALELFNLGVKVVLGKIDDPETYRRLRVDQAALVVATMSDQVNTNVAFTVREASDRVPIITTAESPHSVDILEMAGSSRVLQIYDILGNSLAGWTIAGDCKSNLIARYQDLLIVQSPAIGTPLEGKTLAQSGLRETFGLTVVGIWERGKFTIPRADTVIDRSSVLVLAGSAQSVAEYDEVYSFYHIYKIAGDPVIIIGGGRIGKVIARRFKEKDIPYLIIEKSRKKGQDREHYVIGDAADIEVLQKAWVEKAPAALITTRDDDTNIYLTKYLRSLRQDLQILSRANNDRNVSTLHRAGADFVMSYASLGASVIFNFLRNEDTLLLAEGLNIFNLKIPRSLEGRTLAASGIRERTGCTVVALQRQGATMINPMPDTVLTPRDELILIGTYDAEHLFLKEFAD